MVNDFPIYKLDLFAIGHLLVKFPPFLSFLLYSRLNFTGILIQARGTEQLFKMDFFCLKRFHQPLLYSKMERAKR